MVRVVRVGRVVRLRVSGGRGEVGGGIEDDETARVRRRGVVR